jgi:signal peptidase II
MKRFLASLEPREVGLIVAALALVADQGSKLFMLYGAGFARMAPGEAIPVLPFFNLVMVWNPGVSYGLFPASGGLGTALLVAVQLAAVAALSWLLWRSHSRPLIIGYGLVIGGALGNLIDRLLYGKVADFFHFYGFGYDWYVFNVADLAITLGAAAIIYDVLKPEHSGHRHAEQDISGQVGKERQEGHEV